LTRPRRVTATILPDQIAALVQRLVQRFGLRRRGSCSSQSGTRRHTWPCRSAPRVGERLGTHSCRTGRISGRCRSCSAIRTCGRR
jgi:hypothetical protein